MYSILLEFELFQFQPHDLTETREGNISVHKLDIMRCDGYWTYLFCPQKARRLLRDASLTLCGASFQSSLWLWSCSWQRFQT